MGKGVRSESLRVFNKWESLRVVSCGMGQVLLIKECTERLGRWIGRYLPGKPKDLSLDLQ